VAFGQAEPAFQIKIVLDLFELPLADEQASPEADRQPGHVLADWIAIPLEPIGQLLDFLPAVRATLLSHFQGCGYLLDVRDVLADWLFLGLDMLPSQVNAGGETL
jgi:hypothetical protein